MKKNKKYLFIILIVAVILFLLILSFNIKDDNSKSISSSICENLNNNINNKQDIVIFYKNASEDIDTLKKEYDELNIYELNKNNLNNECIKKILSSFDIYETLKNTNDKSMIVFKKGVYQGIYVGINNYENIISYLEELKLVKFNSDITFSEFKNKITNDKYLLVLTMTRNLNSKLQTKMNKYFKNYNYNMISTSEEAGEKIFDYISKNTKLPNEYPRLLYFSKGKLIKNDFVFEDESFKKFKSDIESLKG